MSGLFNKMKSVTQQKAGDPLHRSRHFIPLFEKRTWWILTGYTLSLFGTGMTEPYLILYLHQLRGIPMSLSGWIIGAAGLAGIIAVLLSGLLADFLSSKKVFLFSLTLNAAGRLLFAGAYNKEIALLASVISGAAAAASWNALSVILAESAGKQKSKVFGVAFALQNLGSGLGAALGGLMIQTHSLLSFQTVFFLDAISFLIFALLGQKWVAFMNRPSHISSGTKDTALQDHRPAAGSTSVLIGLSFAYALFAVVMTGLTTTLFPQWATVQAHASLHVIGAAFLANSLVIVIGQWFILHITEKIRRTHMIAGAALAFALGCLMILTSGYLQPAMASITLISSFAVTAVGETMLFSSLPALVNDLAPERSRGRYNSAINGAWQAGAIFGPPLTGIGLGMHLAIPLFLVFVLILTLLIPFLIVLDRCISKE